jgi:AAA+ superfamily predicted ATPase
MNDLLIKAVVALLANRPKPILNHLNRHFGRNPRKLPIVRAKFNNYRQACLSLAIQTYISQSNRRAKLLGIASTNSEVSLAEMMHPDSFSDVTEGSVQYLDVPVSNGGNLSCPRQALYLVRELGQRYAIYQNLGTNRWDELVVEVVGLERERAEQWFANIRKLADEHSIYKRQTISIKESESRDPSIIFHNVPSVSKDKLILPEEVIAEIDRHTLRFAEFRELLLSHGQHLKRGLLLYGPPGTGKSLSITYMIGAMQDRTCILLNGSAVSYLEDACELARALQPSILVIDDADLIAEDRTRRNRNPVLFELLNQMDGISDDADILFLLTTNRPEAIEPAISSRPGRIDQAILIPLPDEQCRSRLFSLYSRDLPFAVSNLPKLIAATKGVSAAFIRELVRKAALLALEEGTEQAILDSHFETALRLMRGGDAMTARLLGDADSEHCEISNCEYGAVGQQDSEPAQSSDSAAARLQRFARRRCR